MYVFLNLSKDVVPPRGSPVPAPVPRQDSPPPRRGREEERGRVYPPTSTIPVFLHSGMPCRYVDVSLL
jgi:hypothetical protein